MQYYAILLQYINRVIHIIFLCQDKKNILK